MHPPTILIVDDQKHMLALLRASVAEIGGRILTAGSGNEALLLAAATPIDLLLIDYEMPGLSGVQTVRQLKLNPAYAKLPIIMITARGQNRVRADSILAGVTLVMLKPFSPAELAENAQRLLAETDTEA